MDDKKLIDQEFIEISKSMLRIAYLIAETAEEFTAKYPHLSVEEKIIRTISMLQSLRDSLPKEDPDAIAYNGFHKLFVAFFTGAQIAQYTHHIDTGRPYDKEVH